jgi:class 3 adenylate cyclase/GAF domain-containing protein
MDKNLRKVGQVALSQLRKSVNADSIVCYFHNALADYYWLFHTDGVLRYPYQMHGGVAYAEQLERITYRQEQEDEFGIVFFRRIPTELSRKIFWGEPFAKRERVKHCIRIHIRTDQEDENSADSVIFLNYVDSPFPTKPEAKKNIGMQFAALKQCLGELGQQPRLDEVSASRMRSAMFKFRRQLGDILVTEASSETFTEGNKTESDHSGEQISKASQQLYDLVVSQARKLIKPANGAKNVLCTLNLVNTNNVIEIVSPKDFPTNREWGIVEHVARTGAIYLVSDVEKYVEDYDKNVDSYRDDESRPPYVEGNEETRCELAVPLMLQKRIIGVLNIEANQPNAYDDTHIDMLFQFASSAVLAVRQTLLWKDLRIAVAQQNLISHLGNEQEIFAKTLEAVKSLGYEAAIWDVVTKTSYPKGRLKPRKKGFTNWVSEKKSAVALGDQLPQGSEIPFECHRGYLDLDSQSGLFTNWSPMQPPPLLLAIKNRRRRETARDVVTSLGFPIFSVDTVGGKPSLSGVRAVMWVSSERHFLSLLNDESWCLSLLCRNASTALKVLADTQQQVDAHRQRTLQYHFGENWDPILKLHKQRPSILNPRKRDSLIVLNIDVRGSTQLGVSLANKGQSDRFVELIETYHREARDSVLDHGGVMDKTMGDGVMALFNVYQKNILPIDKPPKDPRADAVACAFDIFEKFAQLLQKYEIERRWAVDPLNVRLGAALTEGSGFIGSFYEERGLDYTILGDVANDAGKLVDRARVKQLIEYFEEWLGSDDVRRNSPITALRSGTNIALSEETIGQLIVRLRKSVPDVLLADYQFLSVAETLPYEGYTLNPDRNKPNRAVLILRHELEADRESTASADATGSS